MTLKPGVKGFLQLGDSFKAPRWREALIISIQKPWLQVLVSCQPEEVEVTGLTFLEHGNGNFCLVEAQQHQLLSGVTEEFKALGCDTAELLRAGLLLITNSEEELHYATASEPQNIQGQRQSRRRRSSQSSSTSASSPNEVEENLADQLKSEWLGLGTREEKTGRHKKASPRGHKKSRRFALIERDKKKKEKESSHEALQASALRAAVQSGDPIQSLLALQLAQTLKQEKAVGHRRRRRSGDSRSTSRSSNSSDSSSGSREDRKLLKGHSKAVYSYRRSGKRMFARPLRHVKKFVQGIQEELGAEDKPFRIIDYTKKISWGKQRNLQRCHHLVALILEYLLKEEYEKGALQCVLTLQAIHQASLDNGEWQVAWLLTHTEDPFQRKLFGGDPNSLQHVTSYLRSMNELAKTTENLRRKGSGKGEAEELEKATPKGKGKGKLKDKEKDKSSTEV